jgi:hypothetical protein
MAQKGGLGGAKGDAPETLSTENAVALSGRSDAERRHTTRRPLDIMSD